MSARRKAEDLITQGRVLVNGRKVTELGSKVDPAKDEVKVDGVLVQAQEHVYFVLNKPKGCVSTVSDPEGRPTVMQLGPRDDTASDPIGRDGFEVAHVA